MVVATKWNRATLLPDERLGPSLVRWRQVGSEGVAKVAAFDDRFQRVSTTEARVVDKDQWEGLLTRDVPQQRSKRVVSAIRPVDPHIVHFHRVQVHARALPVVNADLVLCHSPRIRWCQPRAW